MLQILLYGLTGYLALCYLGGMFIAVRMFVLHEYRDQPYADVEMRFDDAYAPESRTPTTPASDSRIAA